MDAFRSVKNIFSGTQAAM